MNGLSYLSLGLETLRLMRNAGFDQLNVSLVSAAEETHRVLKRPHDLRRYLDVVQQASSLGFRIISYQILGLPSETLDSMVETMVLMARLPVMIGASLFYLTPGCPLSMDFPPMNESEMMRSRSTAMAIETNHFCRDDLYTLFVTARILNFLKGIPLQTHRVGLQEALERAQALGERGKIGATLIKKILDEKRLYASTRQGLKPLFHFRSELFFRVWEKLGSLQTIEGRSVDC